MEGSFAARGVLKVAGIVLGILVALVLVLGVVIVIGANHLRGPLISFVSSRTGRDIRVNGALEVHLLSLHPTLTAERVSIGNPPWVVPGVTAEIGRLTLVFDLPGLTRPLVVRKLEMDSTTLHLVRDSQGRANWQWLDPAKGDGKGPPLIRSLSMVGAQADLDDQKRHLQFKGTVTAGDVPSTGDVRPLRIEGSGDLNGAADTFTIDGDPLATASHDRPYGFSFVEQSSGSKLTGHGSLSRPFDFRSLDSSFDATGKDIKDLYFLTGLTLPDTGPYHLTGQLQRRGTHFEYNHLVATSGRSDLKGVISVETASGRAQIDADMSSQTLFLADLGARAAGKESPQADKSLLIPDKTYHLSGIRRSDAAIRYHAQLFQVGKLSFHTVAARATINHGVLTVTPLSAVLADGKLNGQVRIDASRDVPATDLDLRVTNLQLGALTPAAQPPVDGPLIGRLSLEGHGSSLHEFAAGAKGTATFVLPHGTIRASLAELGGIDLNALGLMMTRNHEDTGIRCAVGGFKVDAGIVSAERLVVDTDPVLITGEGDISLDSETLDLKFRGRPKKPRLRLRAPVLVHGTLGHPTVSLEKGHTAVQAGEAVALGVLLTPIAAMLAFVDPGLAKNADCAALLAQAKSDAAATKATNGTVSSKPTDGTAPPKSTDGTVPPKPAEGKSQPPEKSH